MGNWDFTALSGTGLLARGGRALERAMGSLGCGTGQTSRQLGSVRRQLGVGSGCCGSLKLGEVSRFGLAWHARARPNGALGRQRENAAGARLAAHGCCGYS